MTLQKESADAFRQCLRILAPRHTPDERRDLIRNAEDYIAQGKWIPALKLRHIAQLFYPYDSTRELAMLSQMEKAIETKELIHSPPRKDVLLAADLAAWPDCPPVPQESPLRYWLPDWMQTAQETVKALQRSAAQDAAILTQVTSLGYDPLALPQNKPGKAGVKSAVRNALSKDHLFTGATVFDKAWERLSANGEIVIQK